MLASLLPGLRELRAPLAAGYLWIAALWLAFEPLVPSAEDATGVLASLYRAAELASGAVLGIAVSFGAYLAGILSVGTLSRALRALFLRGQLAVLPHQAVGALEQIARDRLERYKDALGLSRVDLDQFIRKHTLPNASEEGLETKWLPAGSEAALLGRRPRTGSRQWTLWRGQTRDRHPDGLSVSAAVGVAPLGSARSPWSMDGARLDLLKDAILRDLNVVATTRLLGLDQELYAAVDRHRAEVEFRLAVVPPVVALAATVGFRYQWWVLLLLISLGLAVCAGLFREALRTERTANAILLDAMADGRIDSPTLERMQNQATLLGGQGMTERHRSLARDISNQLRDVLAAVDKAMSSDPPEALRARRHVEEAGESLQEAQDSFPSGVMLAARSTLADLEAVVDAWRSVIDGDGPADFDVWSRVDQARLHHEQFREEVHNWLGEVYEAPALGQTPPTATKE